MRVLRRWLPGLCAVLLACSTLAGAVRAAGPARIEAFDVERIASLQIGSRLNFTVFGSPGAQVQLDIEGARQSLPMPETESGIYEAVYVVDGMDRIGAGSRVIATLRSADTSSVRAVLEEPLLLDGNVPPTTQTHPPVHAPTSPVPTQPSTAPFEPPPVQQARRPPQPWPAPPEPATVPPGCRQCAIVESIRSVEAAPQRPPHSVAGNLLGALFGENVAEKVDRHVDRVNTAIDRAVKGRAPTPLPNTRYEVLLRLPDGRRLTRLYDAPPPFRAGDMLVLPDAALRAAQPSAYRGESDGGGGSAGPAADSLAQGRW